MYCASGEFLVVLNGLEDFCWNLGVSAISTAHKYASVLSASPAVNSFPDIFVCFWGWSENKGEVVFLAFIQQSDVKVLFSWLFSVTNIAQHW